MVFKNLFGQRTPLTGPRKLVKLLPPFEQRKLFRQWKPVILLPLFGQRKPVILLPQFGLGTVLGASGRVGPYS